MGKSTIIERRSNITIVDSVYEGEPPGDQARKAASVEKLPQNFNVGINFQKEKDDAAIAREAKLSPSDAGELLRSADESVNTSNEKASLSEQTLKISSEKVDADAAIRIKATDLQNAVLKRDKDLVKHLLEQEGAKDVIDDCNHIGETPLSLAVKAQDDEILKLLLDNGAKYDYLSENKKRSVIESVLHDKYLAIEQVAYDTGGKTVVDWLRGLFHDATLKKNDETLRRLNRTCEGGNELHLAVRMGNWREAFSLLGTGIDVNETDKDGNTPLMLAVLLEEEWVVKILVSLEGDWGDWNDTYSYKMSTRNKRHENAIDLALTAGNSDIIDSLFSLLEKQRVCPKEIRDLIKKNDEATVGKINEKDKDGRTPLHYAAQLSSKLTSLFIDKGADINCQDKKDQTPLMYAIFKKNNHLVELLLGNQKLNLNMKDKWGRNALHLSAIYFPEALESLFDRGGEVTETNNGDTLLHVTVRHAREDVMEVSLDILKKRGFLKDFIDRKNKEGDTPLYMAEKAGCWEKVKVLLGGKAKIITEQADLSASLRLAVFKEDVNLVKYLLDKGKAEGTIHKWIDDENDDGQWALTLAVKQKNYGLMELLLGYGADHDPPLWRKEQPLILAYKVGGYEMVNELKRLAKKSKPEALSNLPNTTMSRRKKGSGGFFRGLKRLWRKMCNFFRCGYFWRGKKENGGR